MRTIIAHNPQIHKRPGEVRGYGTPADRERAIAMLARRGFNHFVCFKDVQSDYALMYGIALWMVRGVYICR